MRLDNPIRVRRWRWLLSFPVLLAVAPPVTIAQEEATYLCLAEESTGFRFDGANWARTGFRVDGEKFLIRPLKADENPYLYEGFTYGVVGLGENKPSLYCKPPDPYAGHIACSLGVGELNFSPASGRYLQTYTAGYWDGADDNDNTPNMTRGRCSKL